MLGCAPMAKQGFTSDGHSRIVKDAGQQALKLANPNPKVPTKARSLVQGFVSVTDLWSGQCGPLAGVAREAVVASGVDGCAMPQQAC